MKERKICPQEIFYSACYSMNITTKKKLLAYSVVAIKGNKGGGGGLKYQEELKIKPKDRCTVM